MTTTRKDIFACPNKQKSRVAIHRTIARLIHAPLARILIMPGSERFELDTVLEQKWNPSSIYLVEKLPAVLANFTRRHNVGQVNYGKILPPKSNILRMHLSQAARELIRRGVQLDACHLDFCSHCEAGEMLAEIREFVRSGVLKDNGYVAITYLAGREHNVEALQRAGAGFEVVNVETNGRLDTFASMSDTDRGRLRHVWETLGFHVQIRQFGKYQNIHANNPMCWMVAQIHTKERPQTKEEQDGR